MVLSQNQQLDYGQHLHLQNVLFIQVIGPLSKRSNKHCSRLDVTYCRMEMWTSKGMSILKIVTHTVKTLVGQYTIFNTFTQIKNKITDLHSCKSKDLAFQKYD